MSPMAFKIWQNGAPWPIPTTCYLVDYNPYDTRLVVTVTLIDDCKREEGVVALHVNTELLITKSGWEPVLGIKGNEKADFAAKSALDLPCTKVGVP